MHDRMKVLFVDDEKRILDGLRRMLRSMRNEWTTFFAAGGQEALSVLEAEPVDVVVSDIRMPGMDGVALLTEVRNRYPRTVRIALSGQAAKETVLSSVGLVHQYQAKPCDPEVIKSTLARIRLLNELLEDDALKAALAGISSVPSTPEMYSRLIGQLTSEEVSTDEVAGTISRNLGMSARVVQLVSSAFFARPVDILEPSEAVDFLGLDILKTMASSDEAFSQFSRASAPVEAIEEHSLITAEVARQIAIAENADKRLVNQAFLAGLFHDIGKILFAELFPEKFTSAGSTAEEEGITIPEAESSLFGAPHARAGAYLMGLWGLPEPIVEAIVWHHCPARSAAKQFGPLAAVHAADVLAHEADRSGAPAPTPQVDEAWMSKLNLTGRLDAWRKASRTVMQKETVNV